MKDNVDWDAYRREAAKDILCAQIMHSDLRYYGDSISAMIEGSVRSADKLIEQLKEDKQ